MKFKRLPITKHNNKRDLDNAKDYPTIADLISEQNDSKDFTNSVHYRRDLDSLG